MVKFIQNARILTKVTNFYVYGQVVVIVYFYYSHDVFKS